MEQVEADHCYRNEAIIDANSMDKSKIIDHFVSLDMQLVLK